MCKNNKELIKVIWGCDFNNDEIKRLDILKEKGLLNFTNDYYAVIIKTCDIEAFKFEFNDISDKDILDFVHFFLAYFDQCDKEIKSDFSPYSKLYADVNDVIYTIDDGALITDEVINNLLNGDADKTLNKLLEDMYKYHFELIINDMKINIEYLKVN